MIDAPDTRPELETVLEMFGIHLCRKAPAAMVSPLAWIYLQNQRPLNFFSDSLLGKI